MTWTEMQPLLHDACLDTLFMVWWSTLYAVLGGLPLGLLLVLTDRGALLQNVVVNKVLGAVLNLGRSLPFIILIVWLIPFSRAVVGTSIGPSAAVVALAVGAVPFFARLVESSVREVDHGLVEAVQSMGGGTWTIVFKVLLPQALPSLIAGLTTTVITLIGYSAMARRGRRRRPGQPRHHLRLHAPRDRPDEHHHRAAHRHRHRRPAPRRPGRAPPRRTRRPPGGPPWACAELLPAQRTPRHRARPPGRGGSRGHHGWQGGLSAATPHSLPGARTLCRAATPRDTRKHQARKALFVRTTIKLTAAVAAAAALTLGLSACSAPSDTSAGSEKKGKDADPSAELVVAASPTPHGDILNFVRDNLAAKAGLKLKVRDFNDYVLPNTATQNGEVDANFFQHKPYLDDFNKKNKTDIVPVVNVEIEPLGLYSKKDKKVSDLGSGSTIAVPNDATNEGRALKLLADNGVIKLKDGVGAEAKLSDVEDKKGVKFTELEAAQIPSASPTSTPPSSTATSPSEPSSTPPRTPSSWRRPRATPTPTSSRSRRATSPTPGSRSSPSSSTPTRSRSSSSRSSAAPSSPPSVPQRADTL
ncbi:hypothetical protein GCM10020000_65950 [Streptomyces olivoverticillatus]